MMNRAVATSAVLGMVLIAANLAEGTTLDPAVRFSTLDQNGDGTFEQFDTFASGSVSNAGLPTNRRMAHVEFDLSAFAGQTIDSALLEFTLATNNHFHQTRPSDDHDRTFDVNLFLGNGAADLSDAVQTDNVTTATVTYHNNSENPKEFSVDITSDTAALLGTIPVNSYLGVSLVALETHGGGWGPSLFRGDGADFAPQLVIDVVPEPESFALLILGSIGLVWRRRHPLHRALKCNAFGVFKH